MDVPDLEHQSHEESNPIRNTPVRSKDWRWLVGVLKHWASHHTAEILWAFLFAVLAGYAFALYSEEPKPYTIYVVADPDTDAETLKTFQREQQKDSVARIGGVKVQVQIELLADQESQSATKKAEELVGHADTLMVIQHGRSQKIEHSVQTYFGARPQVPLITTVATDDDLLRLCEPGTPQTPVTTEANKREGCFDGYWFNSATRTSDPFVPLLQLSPPNEVQGRSAVQFASDRGKRRFLVVLGDDPNDQSYTDGMSRAYSAAIRGAKAELVGVRHMNALPSEADLDSWRADCILYAGGIGEAQTLFNRLSGMKSPGSNLIVVLSDSVIQSRGTDADLAQFTPVVSELPGALHAAEPGIPLVRAAKRERLPAGSESLSSLPLRHDLPVNFTYQTDAADYNSHSNPYADDALLITLQLISDLNNRGGDLALRFKSLLHVSSVTDARRNVLRIMRENASSRTWYKSASEKMPYIFEGYKQYGGMFHVWQVKQGSTPLGSEMDDVDHWHTPKTVVMPENKSVTAHR